MDSNPDIETKLYSLDDGVCFRVCKVLQGILATLDDLPLTDPTNQELFDKLEMVRAKVKQVRNYPGQE